MNFISNTSQGTILLMFFFILLAPRIINFIKDALSNGEEPKPSRGALYKIRGFIVFGVSIAYGLIYLHMEIMKRGS